MADVIKLKKDRVEWYRDGRQVGVCTGSLEQFVSMTRPLTTRQLLSLNLFGETKRD
jgi:hypothetical protein